MLMSKDLFRCLLFISHVETSIPFLTFPFQLLPLIWLIFFKVIIDRRVFLIWLSQINRKLILGPVRTTRNFVCFAKKSVNAKPFSVRTIFFIHENFVKRHQTSKTPSSSFGGLHFCQARKSIVPWQLPFNGSSYFVIDTTKNGIAYVIPFTAMQSRNRVFSLKCMALYPAKIQLSLAMLSSHCVFLFHISTSKFLTATLEF